jgi:hypothetical protein
MTDSPAAVLVDPVSEDSAKFFTLGSDKVLGAHAVLYDASGNPWALVLDNSIYRLETRSSLVGQVGGSGGEVKVTTITDTSDSNQKRLQTEARIAPGSSVNIGTQIPSNPAELVLDFLTNGGSEDMLVDGSSTPVNFDFVPGTGETVALQAMALVFTADDFDFDGASFGPNAILTTGIEVKLYVNSTETVIFTLKQNEDFVRVPGEIPLVNNTGPKDLLVARFGFGGLVKLHDADGDYLRITINDDLTSIKLKYLTATVYGALE